MLEWHGGRARQARIAEPAPMGLSSFRTWERWPAVTWGSFRWMLEGGAYLACLLALGLLLRAFLLGRLAHHLLRNLLFCLRFDPGVSPDTTGSKPPKAIPSFLSQGHDKTAGSLPC